MTDLQLGGLYEYRYDEEDCERREKAKLILIQKTVWTKYLVHPR